MNVRKACTESEKMRYRVLIQDRSNGDIFVCQFAFESDNINEVIPRLKRCLSSEINKRSKLLEDFLPVQKELAANTITHTGICVNCGHRVIKNREQWFHANPDKTLTKKCGWQQWGKDI